jgi:hypothetical protein
MSLLLFIRREKKYNRENIFKKITFFLYTTVTLYHIENLTARKLKNIN